MDKSKLEKELHFLRQKVDELQNRERKRAEEEIQQNQLNLKQQNEEYLAINEELNESNARIQDMNESLVHLVSRLEKSESEKTILSERLNEAQQISKLGSWEWNIKTGEVWWSDELYRIFEVDPNRYVPSVEGNSKFVHPEDTEEYHKAAFKCLETCENLDFDLRIITPSGVVKHCKSTGKVFCDSDGNPVRFAGSFTDITIQKQLYNELLAAKEKAEESDRLKSAFLANMSHEIRTPMNAIIGFSEVLLKPGITPDKLHKFASIVKERSYDLLRIVEDILDVSKIEVGQLVISESEAEISTTMHDIYEYFFQKLSLIEKKAHLKLKLTLADEIANLKVETDVQRLKQIIYNLIDNAIKFTDDGQIEFGCRKNSSSELLFYVKDTGTGISENKKSIIFDRFRQAEDNATSKKYGGSGLGLSIVKGILDLMKGRVWVESTLGKGTTFYFTIPLKEVSGGVDESGRNESVYHNGSENYILVVEDDHANIEYLKVLLGDCGFKTFFAETGRDAIDLVESEPSISIILMDVRLPDINGLDLTKEILKKKPEMKIIAQTAYATPLDIKECMDAGCTGYVSKPINSGVLLKYVEEYL